MSKKSPRNYSAEFKAKVALEAIRAEKTIRQIATKYSIHATQINRWKSEALKELKSSFSKERKQIENDQQSLIDNLYQRIGELSCENDFLKKSVWD